MWSEDHPRVPEWLPGEQKVELLFFFPPPLSGIILIPGFSQSLVHWVHRSVHLHRISSRNKIFTVQFQAQRMKWYFFFGSWGTALHQTNQCQKVLSLLKKFGSPLKMNLFPATPRSGGKCALQGLKTDMV